MKKKIYKLFVLFLSLTIISFFVSCSSILDKDVTAQNSAYSNARASVTLNPSVDITINLFGVPAKCTKPGIWAWAKATSDVNYTSKSWPGDLAMISTNIGGYAAYTYTLTVDPAYDLGILFNNLSGGSPQTADIIIPKDDISSEKTLYFNWNSMAYYETLDECIGILGGKITTLTDSSATIICTTSLLSDSTITDDITVVDSEGNALSVTSAVVKSDVLTVVVESGTGSISNVPYQLSYNEKTVTVSVSTELIESKFASKAAVVTDLGLSIDGNTVTFKTWAPTASAVSVLLYDSAANAYDTSLTADFDGPGTTTKDYKVSSYEPKEIALTIDNNTGVWSVSSDETTGYNYYKYKLTIDGTTYYVSDIWHNVAGADSNASQIATVNDSEAIPANWEASYTNPFGNTGTEVKKYNDAIIYEMHIRDWSRAVVTDSTGKFLDIANGTEIMNHLKDLGVTHVQILPMFDYAQLNSNLNYNWGYNPYHYNVPEGRYVTEGYTDGTQAVKEMRQMIKAFHDEGIAVIMDVVYNHTSSTKTGSLYDSTVPGYFYRQDTSGNYIDGSGCGNEFATNHVMAKKYVIESLKHWMNDYHINGFRFDLMGCLEASTMKEIYDALYQIDENVLVYGEPWTGGTSGVVDGATSSGKGSVGYGYGAFDDDFRDAIKGGEFGGFQLGQVQGNFSSNIETGLKGDEITKNSRNSSGITGLAIHYAECHDNYTLFDKLVYSTIAPLSGDFANKFAAAYTAVMNDSNALSLIKKEQELAGAYVILSQGMPFINGGQEFMRTKKGDPDSYAADKKGGITWTSRYNGGNYVAETDIDDVNTIDLTMKETYSDVYNIYKGLIALRKSSTAFTSPTTVEAESLSNGVTKYKVTGTNDSYEILFNAKDSVYLSSNFESNGTFFGAGLNDVSIVSETLTEGYLVNITDGTVNIDSTATKVLYIPAKSFIIVKK